MSRNADEERAALRRAARDMLHGAVRREACNRMRSGKDVAERVMLALQNDAQAILRRTHRRR